MGIRAVFLDVDGTVVDTEPRNRRAIEEVARIGGYHIKPGDWNFLAGQGDAIIWRQLVTMKPDLGEVFNTAASFERACLNAKLLRVQEVCRIEETAQAISLFRENSLAIATVSNAIAGDAGESLKNVGYNLSDDFIFSMFLEDIRAAGLQPKPHPDPYLGALHRMNDHLAKSNALKNNPLNPADCLILEDSRTGARAGLQSGMVVVQMTDESPALDKDEVAEYTNRYHGKYYPVSRVGLTDICKHLVYS